MKLLLDTHALLWFVAGEERLSQRARRAMEHSEAELIVSAATVWEMAIKSSLGRLTLPVPVEDYFTEKIESGLRIAPIEWSHAAAVEKLPFHHRDPFDRLLAAQALVEKWPMVTADPIFRDYKVNVVW